MLVPGLLRPPWQTRNDIYRSLKKRRESLHEPAFFTGFQVQNFVLFIQNLAVRTAFLFGRNRFSAF